MRVLLAQANQASARIFRTALTAAGHEVLAAGSGEHAIRIALQEHPDVIVTELALPIVDGWQVLHVLRTYSPTKVIPVVALTSEAEAETETRALGAGFRACINVSAAPEDLVKVVEDVARHGAGEV
ncbi:MAG: response regulator [Longimicrobiales bacterium]